MMKKVFVWVLGTLVVICAAAAALMVFADSVLTKAINEGGHRILNVETHVDTCRLSLLTGTLTLSGIELKNPEGFRSPRMVHLEQISLTISPRTILTDRVRVKEVEIRGADLTYEAAGFGQSNLSVFMEDLRSRLDSGPGLRRNTAPGDRKTVTIDRFHVEGGRVTLQAVFSKGKPVVLPLPPVLILNIGKYRNMGFPEAVAEVLRQLGHAALSTAGRPDLSNGPE